MNRDVLYEISERICFDSLRRMMLIACKSLEPMLIRDINRDVQKRHRDVHILKCISIVQSHAHYRLKYKIHILSAMAQIIIVAVPRFLDTESTDVIKDLKKSIHNHNVATVRKLFSNSIHRRYLDEYRLYEDYEDAFKMYMAAINHI
jgi:hypothetical protein